MKRFTIILFFMALLAGTSPVRSQCSMCRAVAESGAKDEKTRVARGLNSGILYLLAMPYIIGGVAFVVWRRNRRKNEPVNP